MNMKNQFNRLNSLLVLLIIATFLSCEKDISEEEVGIENVFIPQSISASTTDNNYAVPGTINYGAAKNFKDDEQANKVLIYLGVSKSGKAETQAFTVNITSRTDTINQIIAGGSNLVLLPTSAFSIPASVSLGAGESTANFNMVIDKPTLKTFAGKKVAACISLANTTRYTLNDKTKKVIVIIDVNALQLK
ncbi:DUF1735 domain-containing protein [Pedobacter jejuensis]|uniref:DUF1735 domain-containing protein n=2 Tax=Pedobacter jejuensis TaxID=1268550 RepID=A0A3N0C1E4_9SPHI|nr:DUF1735 domain-containing protein [Pedobacter jejuensis]